MGKTRLQAIAPLQCGEMGHWSEPSQWGETVYCRPTCHGGCGKFISQMPDQCGGPDRRPEVGRAKHGHAHWCWWPTFNDNGSGEVAKLRFTIEGGA